MSAFEQIQLEKYKAAKPESKYCPGPADTLVRNFALHDRKACVNAYDRGVGGCKQTGADIMLTFGSEITVLDGNNQPVHVETLKHVDVFLSTKQAEGLVVQLQQALGYNKPKADGPPPDLL